MNERTQILELLSAGKITVDEAERLLDAVKAEERNRLSPAGGEIPTGQTGKPLPTMLKVEVNKTNGETVNIRVPLALLRAGLKLKGLLPSEAKVKVDAALEEKGMEFRVDDLDGKSIDGILEALAQASIHVDGNDETVRIYCE